MKNFTLVHAIYVVYFVAQCCEYYDTISSQSLQFIKAVEVTMRRHVRCGLHYSKWCFSPREILFLKEMLCIDFCEIKNRGGETTKRISRIICVEKDMGWENKYTRKMSNFPGCAIEYKLFQGNSFIIPSKKKEAKLHGSVFYSTLCFLTSYFTTSFSSNTFLGNVR